MTISEADVSAMRGPALLAADGDAVLDHVTLAGRSTLVASLLCGHGLQRGEVVAVLAAQSAPVHELMMGTRRAGLVLMVVDPGHTLEQNAFAINTAGARVLVAAVDQSEMAQSLILLTPYITARYGLDGEFPGHRSLQVARSAAAVRAIGAAPSGTLHHAIGPSGRPVRLPLPDPVADATGRLHCLELVGDSVLARDTVLVGSAAHLSPVAALLATAVLAGGGSVAVPRRPTGVEALRTAFGVDATILHLTGEVAAEIGGLESERVLRLTPPGLIRVVVERDVCPPEALQALTELWGSAVRVVAPGYLDLPDPDAAASVEPACSVTHAEI